jgi:hypothetical protein
LKLLALKSVKLSEVLFICFPFLSKLGSMKDIIAPSKHTLAKDACRGDSAGGLG